MRVRLHVTTQAFVPEYGYRRSLSAEDTGVLRPYMSAISIYYMITMKRVPDLSCLAILLKKGTESKPYHFGSALLPLDQALSRV